MKNCVLNMGTVVVACSFASGCFDCGKPNSTLGDQRPELEYVSSIEAAVLVIIVARTIRMSVANSGATINMGSARKKERGRTPRTLLKIKCQGTWPALVSRKIVESTSFSDP